MPPDFKPAAGLMLLLAGGLVIHAQLNRPAPSAEESRAVYEINWKNFSSNCLGRDGGTNPVLETFCREAAAGLRPSPQCDPSCREATSPFSR